MNIIHIKVGAEKYVFNPEAGTFLNGQGNRLPNSLRGNKQIVEALKKAQKVEKAGWKKIFIIINTMRMIFWRY